MSCLFTCWCFLQLVGVRIPDHAFMRRLCQMCGEPLALTSANISSHTSTVAVHVSGNEGVWSIVSIGNSCISIWKPCQVIYPHLYCCCVCPLEEFEELWPRLAVVVDGGPIGDQSRLGSTVVDLSVQGKYRIIRPGWWVCAPIGKMLAFIYCCYITYRNNPVECKSKSFLITPIRQKYYIISSQCIFFVYVIYLCSSGFPFFLVIYFWLLHHSLVVDTWKLNIFTIYNIGYANKDDPPTSL